MDRERENILLKLFEAQSAIAVLVGFHKSFNNVLYEVVFFAHLPLCNYFPRVRFVIGGGLVT